MQVSEQNLGYALELVVGIWWRESFYTSPSSLSFSGAPPRQWFFLIPSMRPLVECTGDWHFKSERCFHFSVHLQSSDIKTTKRIKVKVSFTYDLPTPTTHGWFKWGDIICKHLVWCPAQKCFILVFQVPSSAGIAFLTFLLSILHK